MALAPWHVPDTPPGCPAVHTVDTTRTAWMLERMVKIKHPVLLVGESGTSKTATTQNFLKNLSEETNVSDTCIGPAWRWPRVSAFAAGQARSHPTHAARVSDPGGGTEGVFPARAAGLWVRPREARSEAFSAVPSARTRLRGPTG